MKETKNRDTRIKALSNLENGELPYAGFVSNVTNTYNVMRAHSSSKFIRN